MEPAIPDGAAVEVGEAGLVLPGDVLVFERSGQLVAHRVLGWLPRRRSIAYVTRGDSSAAVDEPVLRSRVLGRATCRVSFRERVRATHGFLRYALRRLIEGRE
jgi:hypothetical protein